MNITKATQVRAWRLCVGCGACKYICPEGNIRLENIIKEGIRPVASSENCQHCGKCAEVCPGLSTEHPVLRPAGLIKELIAGWGPIIEVWEGYAADPEMRYNGSSGGLASALALYCLEKKGMHGVLHIAADEKSPCLNKTVLSRSREDILDRTGSRYSPASPCDGLELVEKADGPCVFLGKPCDLAGLRKAQAMNPGMGEKLGLAISIFCAGTPATQGTLDLMKRFDATIEEVEAVRYRGRGWPGNFSVKIKGEARMRALMTYEESWGFVQKYRPYRCYLCPDGTGEFSDIACGDPWYREIKGEEKGYSLALVRTQKGREILHGAIAEGYVVLKQAAPEILHKSQINLLLKRSAVWGRLLALRVLGIPTPRLKGFSLFDNWRALSIRGKFRSIVGTVRRALQRKYYRPLQSDR